MTKLWLFNYDSTASSDDEATWDASDVAITFQLGWFEADGSPSGVYKPDNTQWITGVTIPAARITGTPNTIFFNLSGATDFLKTASIRFRFKDTASAEKLSAWLPIDFMASPVLFIKLEDTTNSYGITSWIEAI